MSDSTEKKLDLKILDREKWDESQSFNAIISNYGTRVAFARFEKKDFGFAIKFIRMVKKEVGEFEIQDLKDSRALLISRRHDVPVAELTLDNLSINMQYGFLQAKGRLF